MIDLLKKYKKSGERKRVSAENAFVQAIRGVLSGKEKIIIECMNHGQDDFIEDMKKLGLYAKKDGSKVIISPIKDTSTRDIKKSKLNKPLKIDSDLISVIEDLK